MSNSIKDIVYKYSDEHKDFDLNNLSDFFMWMDEKYVHHPKPLSYYIGESVFEKGCLREDFLISLYECKWEMEFPVFMDLIRKAWHVFGDESTYFIKIKDVYTLNTGGWSENEAILNAMNNNINISARLNIHSDGVICKISLRNNYRYKHCGNCTFYRSDFGEFGDNKCILKDLKDCCYMDDVCDDWTGCSQNDLETRMQDWLMWIDWVLNDTPCCGNCKKYTTNKGRMNRCIEKNKYVDYVFDNCDCWEMCTAKELAIRDCAWNRWIDILGKK